VTDWVVVGGGRTSKEKGEEAKSMEAY